MNEPLIAPSLLSADFAHLQRELEMINDSEADMLHFDVMDGTFVPNISFGFPVLSVVQKYCTKPIDVHLMIEKPERYLKAFAEGGAATIHVHYEACPNLHRTLNQIRELGCKAGVALNPHTPVMLLEDILEEIDVVLVMSVNPGFGGQTFIDHTIQKVARLKQLLSGGRSAAKIQVDGGVNLDNAPRLVRARADILVAGTVVFSAPNPKTVIQELKNTHTLPLA